MPHDENMFKNMTQGLDMRICIDAALAIGKEVKLQKEKWFKACETHENREEKQRRITAHLDHFTSLAQTYYCQENPEKLVDLLEEVRAYDPR